MHHFEDYELKWPNNNKFRVTISFDYILLIWLINDSSMHIYVYHRDGIIWCGRHLLGAKRHVSRVVWLGHMHTYMLKRRQQQHWRHVLPHLALLLRIQLLVLQSLLLLGLHSDPSGLNDTTILYYTVLYILYYNNNNNSCLVPCMY